MGVFWRFSSLVSKGLLQLVVLAVLARFIEPAEFGLVGIASSISVFVVMFSEVGLGQALIQRDNISQRHIRAAFHTSVMMSFLLIAIIFFSSPYLADFFKEPAVSQILRIISLSFFFIALGIVSKALLQRELMYKQILISEVSAFVIGYGFIGVPLAILDFGVWALVIAVVVQNLFTSLIQLVQKPHSVGLDFSRKDIQELLKFGGGLTFHRIFNNIGHEAPSFIIARLLSAKVLGIYSRAFLIMSLPNRYIGQALENVIFSAMSKIKNEKNKLSLVYIRGISIVQLFLLPISLLMILSASEIINVVLGPNWEEAIRPLQLLLISLPLRTVVKVTDSLLISLNKLYATSISKVVYATLTVVASVVGAKLGSIEGILWGINFAVLINFIFAMNLAYFSISFSIRNLLDSFLPGLLLALIGFILFFPFRYSFGYDEVSPIVFLMVSILPIGLVLLSILFYFPRLFGISWCWMLQNLIDIVPLNNATFARFKEAIENRLTAPVRD